MLKPVHAIIATIGFTADTIVAVCEIVSLACLFANPEKQCQTQTHTDHPEGQADPSLNPLPPT